MLSPHQVQSAPVLQRKQEKTPSGIPAASFGSPPLAEAYALIRSLLSDAHSPPTP